MIFENTLFKKKNKSIVTWTERDFKIKKVKNSQRTFASSLAKWLSVCL